MDALDRYLQTVAELQRGNLRGNPAIAGWKYSGLEDLIWQAGELFQPIPKPSGVRFGKMRQCFANAFRLAVNRPDEFTYVEGLALSIIPIHHAWCVDRRGRAVDVTWRKLGVAYRGIRLSHDLIVQHALETKVYGVFDWTSNAFKNILANGLPHVVDRKESS